MSLSEHELVSLLETETAWAVGCTEPGMVAMAVARATELAEGEPLDILVQVSGSVMKNGRSVGLPGTTRRGLEMASALGASGLDWRMGLSLFDGLTTEHVRRAEKLLESGRIRVCCNFKKMGVYVRAVVTGPRHTGLVTIEGNHMNFTEVVRDGRILSKNRTGSTNGDARAHEPIDFHDMCFSELFQSVLDFPETNTYIARLEEGSEKAMELAKAVLRGAFPETRPSISKGLRMIFDDKVLENDLVAKARLEVAVAVSARMNGAPWPVLTSGGSGNQGLLIGISIGNACKALGVSESKRRRSLLLAHVANIYLKSFTGEISPLCGGVTAGAGVAAATCWLLGGNADQVGAAIENFVGGLYGMICDGAKASCALKMAMAAAEAIICGHLAYMGVSFGPGDGIVSGSVDETIGRAGLLVREGLCTMDQLILKATSAGAIPC